MNTMTPSKQVHARFQIGHWSRALILVLVCLLAFLPGIASIPPTDRDESRYVQATKQMVETGDYADIRLQEESRYKKPIGIYWLQSTYVLLSGQGADAPIWVYRLVSTTGGVLAVLGIYWAGARMFGARAGFIAALGLIGIFALNFEARIAKTDAMLLAAAVAAQAVLGAIYVSHRRGEQIARALPWAFWIAQGVGILVKGPITPLLSILTVSTIVIFDRDRSWLRRLKPGIGLAITAAIALPWLILISWRSGLEFWQESVGNDLFGKVVEGQESHGFPPGYYFLTYSLFMWPFALLALEAGLKAMNRFREDPRLLFLVSWYVPLWLFFELIPTKLPHYVLPAYPALLLLMAWMLADEDAGKIELRRWQIWLWRAGLFGAILVTLALATMAAGVVPFLTGGISILGFVAGIAILAAGWFSVFGRGYLPEVRVGATIASTIVAFAILVGNIVPALSPMWLSPRIAEVFEAVKPCVNSVLSSSRYHEPSLVFLTETGTRLVGPIDAAHDLLVDPECAVALIATDQMQAFTEALPAGLESVEELGRIEGVNYSKGDPLILHFFGAAR